ncbi:22412_t:CDS:1, partial [Gigaspora rosea]
FLKSIHSRWMSESVKITWFLANNVEKLAIPTNDATNCCIEA